MNKFLMVIDTPIRYFFIGLIYFYKLTISKMKPKCCRYLPSCSTYTLIAIKRFGSFKGFMLGVKRIFRCSPKYPCGVDPVPDCIDGEIKFKI